LHQAQLEGGTGMMVIAGAALVGITVGLLRQATTPRSLRVQRR
jgi:hypothetical protein